MAEYSILFKIKNLQYDGVIDSFTFSKSKWNVESYNLNPYRGGIVLRFTHKYDLHRWYLCYRKHIKSPTPVQTRWKKCLYKIKEIFNVRK